MRPSGTAGDLASRVASLEEEAQYGRRLQKSMSGGDNVAKMAEMQLRLQLLEARLDQVGASCWRRTYPTPHACMQLLHTPHTAYGHTTHHHTPSCSTYHTPPPHAQLPRLNLSS